MKDRRFADDGDNIASSRSRAPSARRGGAGLNSVSRMAAARKVAHPGWGAGLLTSWGSDTDRRPAMLIRASGFWVNEPARVKLRRAPDDVKLRRAPDPADGRRPAPRGDAVSASVGGALPKPWSCLLYTSPSPRDLSTSRMPSSA